MPTASDESAHIAALADVLYGTGFAGVIGGLAAWLTVRRQLMGERIVVPEGAPRCSGRPVAGPITAYEEAAFIGKTALAATGGRTYGELDSADPAAAMAKDAALLRSSLFTSILAFGVAVAGVGVGAILVVIGRALKATARALGAHSG